MVSYKGNVVKSDGYRGVCRGGNRLRADAANLNVISGEVRFGEIQVRYLLHKVGATGLSALFFSCSWRERRDRDGYGLHIDAAKL